jgi:hypothetical protein
MADGETLFTAGIVGLVFIAGSFVIKVALGINSPPFLSEMLFIIGILTIFCVGTSFVGNTFFSEGRLK